MDQCFQPLFLILALSFPMPDLNIKNDNRPAEIEVKASPFKADAIDG
jgi:hypothetical protein